MTDPRWFKLLLRGIGLLLLGLAIPSLPTIATYFAALIEQRRQGFGSLDISLAMAVVNAVGVFGQTAFAVYLVTGGGALARYCVRQSFTRCAGCDYDLQGVTGQCPECGLPVPQATTAAQTVVPPNP
jgi:hypothetical protein